MEKTVWIKYQNIFRKNNRYI